MNKLNHIAFIMDGNGRWGKSKNKGRNYGHLKGVETVKKIVGRKQSKTNTIKIFTSSDPKKFQKHLVRLGIKKSVSVLC